MHLPLHPILSLDMLLIQKSQFNERNLYYFF